MRSNTHFASDAQHTNTAPGGGPLALTTPRTGRGALLAYLLALLALTAVFAPVMAALAAQAVVLVRFVGPPALAALDRWFRLRRHLTVLPGVRPVE